MWDHKIRRQIKECSLFVPLISANTQAREEGYFRLEWRLADQRTHLMARNKAFILPVALDDTPDSEAKVPDAFTAAQWTRLPQGETPAAFAERVAELLSPELPKASGEVRPRLADAASSVATAPRPATAPLSRAQRLSLLIAAAAVIGVGFFLLDKFVLSKRPTAGVERSAPTAALAPAPSAIPEKSVAVLPFVNESSDKEQDYFADGLTETMIDLLTKVEDLRVPARSSSFLFKGRNERIAVMAKELGVAHLLEGTVRKAGNRLRISAQLVRTDNGYQIWSETYDRDAKDVFKVQDDISAAVVSALKLKLVAAGINTKVRGTSNVDAYNQYLLGKHYQATELLDPDGIRRVLSAYRKALALDASYGDAEAKVILWEDALADATGDVSGRKRATDALDQLMLRHPDNGSSYRIRGVIRLLEYDWAGARADFEKAIALDPADADAFADKAVLAAILDRLPDAMSAVQKALTLDSLNLQYLAILTSIQIALRDYAAGDKTLSHMAEIDPHSHTLLRYLSRLRLLQGRYAESLAECPKISDERTRLSCVAHAQYSLGHRAEADQALSDLLKTGTGDNLSNLAGVYAWFGDADQAFTWFDKAVSARESGVSSILADRTLDGLHKDPRWSVLLKKMNLPS